MAFCWKRFRIASTVPSMKCLSASSLVDRYFFDSCNFSRERSTRSQTLTRRCFLHSYDDGQIRQYALMSSKEGKTSQLT